MRVFIHQRITVFLALSILLSCSPGPGRFQHIIESKQISGSYFPADSVNLLSQIQAGDLLSRDALRLRSLSADLAAMEKEMLFLQQNLGLFERGFYTADEHDKIEGLLSRYLEWRESLWGLLDFYAEYRERFPSPELQTRGFLIAFGSAVNLVYAATRMISLFMDEPVVVAKLNEPYIRSGIPAGMYDTLFQSITAVDHIEAFKTAWVLFCNEKDDSTSQLHHILSGDSSYAAYFNQLTEQYGQSTERIQYILEKKALLLPAITNRLRHSQIAKLAVESKRKYDGNLYAARGILFERVSRLKAPNTEPITFSRRDVRRILSLLEPGDVILTYTAGYMSNLFLPGRFKHGITYVGSPAQREEAGLLDANLPLPIGTAGADLPEKLRLDRLPSGHNADVIEAVSEGVIYNSLEYLMKSHINRMLVIRPNLTAAERRDALLTAFQLVGQGYDFKFDFHDATYLCCTEVIYRALHGRGRLAFDLTQRAGVPTLTADDIVQTYLASSPAPFNFVLLAEADSGNGGNRARIFTGTEGLGRLQELMR